MSNELRCASGEADPVILDFKAVDFRQTAIQLGLAAPLRADCNLSIRPAGFVNHLDSADDHLDDRRVGRLVGPDVFDRSSYVDVAHLDIFPAFFRCGVCECRIPNSPARRYRP